MKIQVFKDSARLFFKSVGAGFYFMRGIWALSRLPMPIVTIFGGRQAQPDSIWSQKTYKLAQLFAQHGFSVITGGGPGIMKEANCGAASVKSKVKRTLGIGVKGVDVDFVNPCAHVVNVGDFFIRKWLLIHYSIGFVIFPGGIGTADEFFEVLDMLKHTRVRKCPIILMGTDYWKSLTDWYDYAVKEKFILPYMTDVFVVKDDINDAFNLIVHNNFK